MKKKTYIVPDRGDILEYYITQNHSKQECADHFNTTKSTFTVWLAHFGIKKLNAGTKKCSDDLSVSAVIEFYINQCHTKDECCEHFGLSRYQFSTFCALNGIRKSAADTQRTIEAANMKKYGCKYFVSDETKQKTKATCLKKYGVENPSYSAEIKKKISESESFDAPSKEALNKEYIQNNLSEMECSKLFGVSVDLVRKWLKNYGITKEAQFVQQCRENTNIIKYGAISPLLSDDAKARIKYKCMTEYGVSNVAQKNINHYDAWIDASKMQEFIDSHDILPGAYDLAKEFNVHHSAMLNKLHEFGMLEKIDYKPRRSHYENELVTFLHEIGVDDIVLNDRSVLGGKEIDIYIPSHKFGIEFNGEYYHSDANKKYQDHRGRSIKHQQKTLLAESKGVFLFTIFEHEWDESFTSKNPRFKNSKEAIKNRLKYILSQPANKIPGRKCVVKEIDYATKSEFLNKYHTQGNDVTSDYHLGLYYNDELVSCMCFGKSKYNRYDYELTRFCTKYDTIVCGGASKLFKYFVDYKMVVGNNVVSYNDITKTSGNIYKVLGFTNTSIGSPNYWWVNLDNYDVRSRYQEQAAGEIDRMHSAGYNRICDCGTKTWVYTK